MSQPKLSQTVLYEVLVSEIESFKTTKRDYDKILNQTSTHLNRLEELYNQPISLDIEAMRQEHERIKSTLDRALYFPKWLVISFLCLVIACCISVFFNYKQYFTNKDQRTYIEYAHSYIEELEGQLPKNKTRR
jgi:hypothetical protein